MAAATLLVALAVGLFASGRYVAAGVVTLGFLSAVGALELVDARVERKQRQRR
jgi:hypothetical protein